MTAQKLNKSVVLPKTFGYQIAQRVGATCALVQTSNRHS